MDTASRLKTLDPVDLLKFSESIYRKSPIVEPLQESTAILSLGEASAKQVFPEIGFRADATAKLKEQRSSVACMPNPNPNSYS